MNDRRREKLSKFLSLVLRHKPEMFSIALDERGYAQLDDIVVAAGQKFDDVSRDEILYIVEGAEKRRFELSGDQIRARYGHSFPIDLGLDPIEPPEYLYFATAPERSAVIAHGGLNPSDRQFVHLSLTEEIAFQVASNQTDTPSMFRIRAREATQAGVDFFDRSPVVLTRGVPAEYVDPMNAPNPSASSFGRRKKKAPRRR